MNIVKIFFPTFLGILFKNVYCIRKHVCSVIIFYKNCKKTLSSFLDFKNEGGLCKPSESVDFFIKKTNSMNNSFEKKNKFMCQKSKVIAKRPDLLQSNGTFQIETVKSYPLKKACWRTLQITNENQFFQQFSGGWGTKSIFSPKLVLQ